jgi:predicted transcriptional regulator
MWTEVIMSNWTFITNHGAVLSAISRHGKVKAIDIAMELGITERSIRRIITDLAAEGYIIKEREDSVNRYYINHDLPLRRQEMQYLKIKDLLSAFSTASRKEQENEFSEV